MFFMRNTQRIYHLQIAPSIIDEKPRNWHCNDMSRWELMSNGLNPKRNNQPNQEIRVCHVFMENMERYAIHMI